MSDLGELVEKDEHNKPVRVVDTRDGSVVTTRAGYKEIYRKGDMIRVLDRISKERVHIPAEHVRIEKQ